MFTPYLLAGGLSTRMGQDKAFLKVNNQTLLEQALHRLKPLGEPRILSGNPANTERQAKLSTHAPTVPDRTPNAGPLGGIDAALQNLQTAWALILPVDQPNLPTEALQAWIDEALHTHCQASWFLQPTGPEPLPLLLHRDLAAPVAHALHEGDRKLIPTLRRIAGPRLYEAPRNHPEWFLNLNHPHDLLP